MRAGDLHVDIGRGRLRGHAAVHQPAHCRLLAPDASFSVQVNAATRSGATITLSATATSSNADPTPADNTAFEDTVVNATGRDIVVSNTNDDGPGSLRQAIRESNTDTTDVDRIVFTLPGASNVITPLTALPPLNAPVIVDGTSAPAYAGTPVVELRAARPSGASSSTMRRAARSKGWRSPASIRAS